MKKILILPIIIISLVYIIGCAGGSSQLVKTGSEPFRVREYSDLGRVRWHESYSEAIQRARSENKPLFILLQKGAEISDSGMDALVHPLSVEAIESLFVPVALTQRAGNLGEGLGLIDNPSEFNTVIFITDAVGKKISDVLFDDQTIGSVSKTMIAALSESGHEVPDYLQIVHDEGKAEGKIATAIITQHCFWSGEVELGITEGIVSTEPGYIDKFEAMKISFDTSTISYKELLEEAKALGLLDRAYPIDEEQYSSAREVIDEQNVEYFNNVEYVTAPDHRHFKFYLGKTNYRWVPMTHRQAILINNALFFDQNPDSFLSPRQLQMHAFITKKKFIEWEDRIDSSNFMLSWEKTTQKIAKLSKGKVSIH